MRHLVSPKSIVPGVLAFALAACGGEFCLGEDARQQQRIARWIDDLDSPLFAVRQRASENLAKAGRAALEPLATAAEKGSLEVASQAIRLLFELAESDDSAQVVEVLERIAALEREDLKVDKRNSGAGNQAVGNEGAGKQFDPLESDRGLARAMLADIHERFAVREVIRLGGEYKLSPDYGFNGEIQRIATLKLDQNWAGGDEGMKHVARLSKLRILMIHSAPITDKGLEHLSGFKGALRVELYGTDATAEGAEKLAAALPDKSSAVDFRRGALLGVGSDPSFFGPGARIGTVQRDSAADRAGILRGDVITKYNDQDVADFQALTAFIAKQKPGDKAKLEIERGGLTITREVTFGRWQ